MNLKFNSGISISYKYRLISAFWLIISNYHEYNLILGVPYFLRKLIISICQLIYAEIENVDYVKCQDK